MSGWFGVDLDGTLAEYHGWNGGAIGAPIPAMVERVRAWLAEGKEVRIFTARVAASGRKNLDGILDDEAFAQTVRPKIEEWCLQHIGQILPVTCKKDLQMIELWDDRCVHVEANTGRVLG